MLVAFDYFLGSKRVLRERNTVDKLGETAFGVTLLSVVRGGGVTQWVSQKYVIFMLS